MTRNSGKWITGSRLGWRRGLAAGLAAGLLAAGLVVAGPATPAAAAIGPMTFVSNHTDLDRSRDKLVRAMCPTGTVAIDGGGYIRGGGPTDATTYASFTRLSPFGRVGTRSGFAVRAESTRSGPSWRLFAYARCAPAPPGYVITFDFLDHATPNLEKRYGARVTCPRGKNLLSLGASASVLSGTPSAPPAVEQIQVNHRRVGTAVVLYGDWNDHLRVRAYAVCASVDTQVTTSRTGLNKSSPKSATATCPPLTEAYGFGMRLYLNKIYLEDRGLTVWAVVKATGFLPTGGHGYLEAQYYDPLANPGSILVRPWRLTAQQICSA